MDERTPRMKLWLEADGKLVMSDYRVRLLEAIADSGSLSKAAESMRLSYRRAWGKLKELEDNLGYPLVTSESGGSRGGNSVLTKEALAFIDAYRRFQERVTADMDRAFHEELGPLVTPVVDS
jgi:molybdate transport system regulatory protein